VKTPAFTAAKWKQPGTITAYGLLRGLKYRSSEMHQYRACTSIRTKRKVIQQFQQKAENARLDTWQDLSLLVTNGCTGRRLSKYSRPRGMPICQKLLQSHDPGITGPCTTTVVYSDPSSQSSGYHNLQLKMFDICDKPHRSFTLVNILHISEDSSTGY